jgi:probable O-glycosylation ligase (exosortase A-associated)
MRDIILTAFLFGSVPFILWRPAIGIFLWVWVSVMSPHRLTYEFFDYPFAQLIAIATLMGMLFSKEAKRLPVTPVTVVLFMLVLWMNVTTFFALDVEQSLPMWERVMKIQLMIFVSLYLLQSKQHIQVLIWIMAGSVAFFGIKGGLFTLREEGELRVFGPPGSFIEENNALALATIMTVPLLYYLFVQYKQRWLCWGLLATMVLCVFSALGSYSRGGLLAFAATVVLFWWKGRRKLFTGVVLAILVPVAIGFMPEKWMDRMWSIQQYEQDESSMGRINAWTVAVNVANDRPLLGGGFEIATRRVFDRYAPDPTVVRAAHSIYFQMLGEHGYVGLALFVLLWILVWRDASWIIRYSRSQGKLQWALDLARMTQVSLVGYFVGGAFLSLAYYDVPYNLLVVLVLTRSLIAREIKGLQQGAPVRAQVNADEDRALARTPIDPDRSDLFRSRSKGVVK